MNRTQDTIILEKIFNERLELSIEIVLKTTIKGKL